MSNISNLQQYLAAEKASRGEQQKDVPDSDGSKPFLVCIGAKELKATNKKRASWKQILNKVHDFTGDFTEQFSALKEWLEKDWHCGPKRTAPTAGAGAENATLGGRCLRE